MEQTHFLLNISTVLNDLCIIKSNIETKQVEQKCQK